MKQYVPILLGFLSLAGAHVSAAKAKPNAKKKLPAWSSFHRKVFTEQEQGENNAKNQLAFAKTDLAHFNQLVFSWNALRPAHGHFVFYARVRNAQSHAWSKWHRMALWGAHKQESFQSDSDGISSYHHVRLETKPFLADAFTIKIEPKVGASLNTVKAFAVNLSNSHLFKSEKEAALGGLASVCIDGVPQYCQFELDHPRNDGLCSPTSCAMLTAYLLSKDIDPIDFAEKSHDRGLDKYGSWPFNMAHAFECAEGKILFSVKRMNTFKELHHQIAKGIPVVVSVRGQLQGAPRPYHNGHLMVVVGYDAKTKEVVCHDPAVSESRLARKKYHLKSFLQAWERSHRLAYCADPIA